MPRFIDTDYPPLMLAQVATLRAYARDHGRTWEAKLWAEWMNTTANQPAMVSEEENHAGQC
ncbi:MAG: hypothetical protein M3Y41_15200 [Pseudomonadota bacterium]|nr:hypothetical protein [Pseudomonadota bacterium]